MAAECQGVQPSETAGNLQFTYRIENGLKL